jgi:hypothetical protein
MLEQIEARTGVRPTELLVDGGYPSHDAIDQAAAAGVTLYAPVPKPRSKASEPPGPPIDPHLPKPGDSDAVAAWRAAWAPTLPSRSTRSAPRPPRR